MNNNLHVLIIDDSKMDFQLLERLLLKGEVAQECKRVDCEPDLHAALNERDWDLFLSDCHMPDFTPEAALEICRAHKAEAPFILVTGAIGEEEAVSLLKKGAQDFVRKDNLARLLPAIERGLREAEEHRLRREAEEALRNSEEQFRSISKSANDAIIATDANGIITVWNRGAEHAFGYKEQEMLGQSVSRLIPEEYKEAHKRGMRHVSATGKHRLVSRSMEFQGLHKSGVRFPLELSLASWEAQGAMRFSAIIRDITQRKKLEDERERNLRSQTIISSLLKTALHPFSLSDQLTASLAIIVSSTPWLTNTGKGMIHLLDVTGKFLVPYAQCGMDEELASGPAKIPVEKALSEQTVSFDGIAYFHAMTADAADGHYCVPIPWHDRILGVLSLFVSRGHVSNQADTACLADFANTLAGLIERRLVEETLEKTMHELKNTRLEIIRRLGMAAEFKDNVTGQHVIRMSKYAALLGKAAGLDHQECELLLHAAPMHDIGKIGIPDQILQKPGKLDDKEYAMIKKHSMIGYKMLAGNEEEPLKTAQSIAWTHHERWDGSGYPRGLRGEQIPMVGRICAIVDAFDAMTSERPYKKAWSTDEALLEIERSSGTHFDPELVEKFKVVFPDILKIKSSHLEGAAL